jgi:phosphoribosylglycinamide formyltransferase-1
MVGAPTGTGASLLGRLCHGDSLAFDIGEPARLPSAAVDARIAVLASGTGTNLQALLDDPQVGPCIVLALSDRADAGCLERARARNVRVVVVEATRRAEFDRALLEILRSHDVEFVALAGFMRILSREVVGAFRDRILNVHPALLPMFPGAHAVRDALDWGVKVTGATIHLVDEEVDHGPIVLQEAVPVLPEDDEASLHARIREVEHRLFPRAVRLLAEGRLKVEGRRVHFIDGPSAEDGPA